MYNLVSWLMTPAKAVVWSRRPPTWGFSCILPRLPWEEEGDKVPRGSDMTLLLYYSFDACAEGVEIWNRAWEMMTAEFSSSACPPSEAQASRRPHAAAAGLFRLTPSTITVVKEEEICVFTRDKCTLNTALSIPAASLPTDYVEAALIRTTAAVPFFTWGFTRHWEHCSLWSEHKQLCR